MAACINPINPMTRQEEFLDEHLMNLQEADQAMVAMISEAAEVQSYPKLPIVRPVTRPNPAMRAGGIIFEETAEMYINAPWVHLKALKRAKAFPYQCNIRYLTIEGGLSPVFYYSNNHGDPPKKWMRITRTSRVDYKDGRTVVTIHPDPIEDPNPWVFEFLRPSDAAYLANVISDRVSMLDKLQAMRLGRLLYQNSLEEAHEVTDADGERVILRVSLSEEHSFQSVRRRHLRSEHRYENHREPDPEPAMIAGVSQMFGINMPSEKNSTSPNHGTKKKEKGAQKPAKTVSLVNSVGKTWQERAELKQARRQQKEKDKLVSKLPKEKQNPVKITAL